MKLSSWPPSLRTMLRKLKTVPKMSFASSLALSLPGRGRAGPREGAARVLGSVAEVCEIGRVEDAVVEVVVLMMEEEERGRSGLEDWEVGVRVQRRE